jgi:uncharacterized protein YcbK (DUF882 family)
MKMQKHDRRQFFRHAFKLTAGGLALPLSSVARAAYTQPTVPPTAASTLVGGMQRALALHHTHTRERIDLVYAVNEQYVPDAMRSLNRFMRDHYSGNVGQMDPQLFDLLHQVEVLLGSKRSRHFEVISAYRCPETNNHLRNSRGGGVAKRSLHMEGKAIDVRLPGVPLAELRDAAKSLAAGGVGYYPAEQFVHIDTGRVRSWG